VRAGLNVDLVPKNRNLLANAKPASKTNGSFECQSFIPNLAANSNMPESSTES
jgi:hypothetical protein